VANAIRAEKLVGRIRIDVLMIRNKYDGEFCTELSSKPQIMSEVPVTGPSVNKGNFGINVTQMCRFVCLQGPVESLPGYS
jgi:hypothetical protein